MARQAQVTRNTNETQISVSVNLDGSGKSSLAMQIAQNEPRIELISMDSALVYRGMNIGTAKPDDEILAAAPHHLINLISPDEAYSAARFRDDALTLMREITERGNVPLLVGGTMMYFKALIEGMNDLPEADPMVRLMIDTLAIFGVIGVISLIAGVQDALKYLLLPVDQYTYRNPPGQSVAMGIVFVPAWLYYLWALVRQSGAEDVTC